MHKKEISELYTKSHKTSPSLRFFIILVAGIALAALIWLQPLPKKELKVIKKPFVSYAHLYERPRKRIPTMMLMDCEKDELSISFFIPK